jgi:hypothetical protein
VGDAANATKWLNRTAQGFSPGYDGPPCIRPERAAEENPCSPSFLFKPV